MRVAILDDYQQVALASASWPAEADITVFTSHIARTDALVRELEPFDVIVAMRERTPFTAERLSRLPHLKLLVTTGMGNAAIDLDAARDRGITVCGTGLARRDRRADLGADPGGVAAHPRRGRLPEGGRPVRRGSARQRLAADDRHWPAWQDPRHRRTWRPGQGRGQGGPRVRHEAAGVEF